MSACDNITSKFFVFFQSFLVRKENKLNCSPRKYQRIEVIAYIQKHTISKMESYEELYRVFYINSSRKIYLFYFFSLFFLFGTTSKSSQARYDSGLGLHERLIHTMSETEWGEPKISASMLRKLNIQQTPDSFNLRDT